jgi:hypothetical protein
VWSIFPTFPGKSSCKMIISDGICFCFQMQVPHVTSTWHSLYSSCLHLKKTDSSLLAGPVREYAAIYPGIYRYQGKPLCSWSMLYPLCYLGSHQGSVAVDLGQISLSPAAVWPLKVLQLITFNRFMLSLHRDTNHNIKHPGMQKCETQSPSMSFLGLHQ